MFATNLTPEQRLEKAVVRIMTCPKYAALAGVMMIGKRETCPNTPTAKTNGRDEWYGTGFIPTLTDAELRFAILHECYHKLYRHLVTWKQLWKIDPDLTNRACDYVINLKIQDENTDGFAVIGKGWLIDEKYRNMDAAKVFWMLKQDKEGGKEEGKGEGDGGEGGQDQDGGGQDEHDWTGAEELGQAEQEQLGRDIDQAIRQGALSAGKMNGSGDGVGFDELLEPQVDWREVLREFINNTCAGRDYSTWARPNRRYIGMGYYMPSGISEEVGELIIAVDTSGSCCTPTQLTAFFSEVQGICEMVNPERVRVLYWGSSVVADEVYENDDIHTLISSTKPVNGGGTDATVIPEYIKDNDINAQACIVLTDGHVWGDWGTWDMPVLWTVLDHKGCQPDCGKTVHINSADM